MTTTTEIRVSTTSPSQWGRLLSIEVPRQRFDAVRAEVVRDLRKRVTRPGFRRGHVPAALVERDFAERIESTTLERFIPAVCHQAIENESLDVISNPTIQNLVLDDPQVVRLDVAVDVRPKIELQPLDGLRGSRWTSEVSETFVGRALDEIRDQHASYVGVDREAHDGDFVQVSYVPLDDSGAEETERQVENYPFELGAGKVVAEFESAVRGLRPGASGRAEVHYPADPNDPASEAKTVTFVLTLQAVKEKRLPEVDDDLARNLGMETLDALRAQIREDLERRMRDESERALRESLVDSLLQANVFEAPASMVEQYLEAVVGEYDANAKRMGIEPDPERRQEFAQGARPSAERAVRRALVLESLARAHDLHVTEEDVDRWIEGKVEAGGSSANEIRAFFAEARRRRRLRGELTDDKVFDFLKEKAEITEVSRPAIEPEAG